MSIRQSCWMLKKVRSANSKFELLLPASFQAYIHTLAKKNREVNDLPG